MRRSGPEWIGWSLTGFKGLLGPAGSYHARDPCRLWVKYGRTTDDHDGMNEGLKVGSSSEIHGRGPGVKVSGSKFRYAGA